ncbi:helix-turn-helix transcriptional regulator [Seonamhaeicola sp.]|uniref:helix-turn-helix transcriptional regulator n=1 Tax=Seonamhaeicola sp. TaxID=1912245 RepID=UPI0035671C81
MKKLSKKEATVLSYLKEGLRSREIAEKMEISEKTVSTNIQRARKKLGLSNDVNLYLLVATAIEKELI